MLVNYKNANVLTAEIGKGKKKLILVPGINVIEDDDWSAAEKSLEGHIKAGKVVPIYKTETKKVKGKDGKEVETEVKSPVAPDEIPNDQIDGVVSEIKSKTQADKFVRASNKESVRAKAENRKKDIDAEIDAKG